MSKSVTYGEDMPYFSESMRRVTAFREGPWVENLEQLRAQMDEYRRAYWKKRNAPKEAEKLKEDMKRFGL